MNYRDLLNKLSELPPEQLDEPLTVEDLHDKQCYGAEFRVAPPEHGLPNGLPLIVVI